MPPVTDAWSPDNDIVLSGTLGASTGTAGMHSMCMLTYWLSHELQFPKAKTSGIMHDNEV